MRIWKAVQLFVAFHRDKQHKPRRFPYLWPPADGRAAVTDRAENGQEVFILVKGDGSARDVQIKVWPEKIVLRRADDAGWSGLVVTDHSVAVRIAGRWVEVRHDGSVKSSGELDDDITILDADGSIYRWTDLAEIIVSPDGSNISRRSPEGISAITPKGVVVRRS